MTDVQPMSDDQELAKVLAGITSQADDTSSEPPTIQPAPSPLLPAIEQSASEESGIDLEAPVTLTPPSDVTTDTPVEQVAPTITTPATPEVAAPASPASGALEDIKKDAIVELRPLVDKLDLAPAEKFDTYLLLLRSTDDKELIAPAHEAAKSITDETRRAQALLDIIKEIDFLSGQQTA